MTSFLRSAWKSVSSVFSGSKSDVAGETEPIKKFSDSNPPISQPNNCISENPECNKGLAVYVKEKSTLLESNTGPLPVYTIPLEEEQINVRGCKRFSFGKESTKRNRTIMVLGATGAGKSTLINGMINHILGVEWKDSFRFKLVDEGQSKSQAHSQTSEVTAYKINHQEGFKIDHSLTIVDTPGFGDTRGIERDKEITEQLRNLFSAKRGVSEIDAVCFVAQASLARLTPSQKYVFDSVLSIFGKDVAENIRVLVTFADGQRPPVLEAINASGVPCPKTKEGLPVHFKFNNSALFADSKSSAANSTDGDGEDGGFDEMFWNMGTKSMKKFFVALNVIQTKSLTMTREVLKERDQLENSVENLQKQVKLGLAKLEEIKETAGKLKEHEAEISRNENFEFEVTVTKPVQVDISGTGIYLTNCQQCHHTCHDNCCFANDDDKIHCCAMGQDGYCKVCPGKCFWRLHFNQKYKWGYDEVKEKLTVKDLKEKYLKAAEAKTPVQALIEKLKTEYDHVQLEVEKLIKGSAKCLNRLREIALKPNPLSTPEYIDMLIEGEKSEAKLGWKQRVQSLMAMKEKAECMAKLERGETMLQSPPTDRLNQGQSNSNKDKAETNTNQDKAQTDANQDKTETDTNRDKSETDTNQDKTETDTNRDKSETDTNQDKTETDTNPEKTETDSNPDKSETDTNQDKTETDTNPEKTETDSNPDKSETDTNPEKTETDSNPDKTETDTNQDETEPDTNQDETEPDFDIDQNKTKPHSDIDSNMNEGQDSELDTNSDKTNSDTNKDLNRADTVTEQT